jgi:hypothetical protein
MDFLNRLPKGGRFCFWKSHMSAIDIDVFMRDFADLAGGVDSDFDDDGNEELSALETSIPFFNGIQHATGCRWVKSHQVSY